MPSYKTGCTVFRFLESLVLSFQKGYTMLELLAFFYQEGYSMLELSVFTYYQRVSLQSTRSC